MKILTKKYYLRSNVKERKSQDSVSTESSSIKPQRTRKTEKQTKILETAFVQGNFWEKQCIKNLAVQTGLTQAQVYKWGWDYSRKAKKLPKLHRLLCGEIIQLPELETSMFMTQRNYRLTLRDPTQKTSQTQVKLF